MDEAESERRPTDQRPLGDTSLGTRSVTQTTGEHPVTRSTVGWGFRDRTATDLKAPNAIPAAMTVALTDDRIVLDVDI